MKVAILSESDADQKAVHEIVNALLRQKTDLHDIRVPEGGWARVFKYLPGILKGLHFGTDVDALAVILDSDTTLPHHANHDEPNQFEAKCRLCQLRAVAKSVENVLRGKLRPTVKTAIGLAMPCIEAWLLCGSAAGRSVNEPNWVHGLQQNRLPYKCSDLKAKLHGKKHTTHLDRVSRMVKAARRISANIAMVEASFPNGFGPFAADVRGWLT